MQGHSEIYNKLIKFQDQDVPLAQIRILVKLYENRGNVLPSNEISSVQKESHTGDPTDESYMIHSLVQGVYKPRSSDFAQCIIFNPESGRKLPIDTNSTTLKLNYEFNNTKNHKSQVKTLEKCKDIDLPVGMLFRIESARYMVLGLLRITSITGLKITLESYELSDKESVSLKEKVLSVYHKNPVPATKRMLDADYPDLIKNIDESNVSKDYKMQSEHVKIPHLINDCEKGQWAIPNFQRYFDWDKNKIKKFLNSVFYGYYVGALLIWDTADKSSVGMKPIDGVVINPDNLHTNKIILDGQQRITSLYYAIKSPKIDRDRVDSYFYINFRKFFSSEPNEVIEVLPNELSQEECFNKFLFPFNRLLDYAEWIDDFEDYLDNNTSLDLREDIRPLCRKVASKLNFVKEFTISYITLVDMPINDVVHVFERINTTGKRLDPFDLLIVRMSIHDINLRKLWDSACHNYQKIREYFDRPKDSTKGLTVLQSMALCYTRSHSCKRANVLDIFDEFDGKDDFLNKWNRMVKDVNNAIARLELISDTGFGVISRRLLPFEPMIPVMAALLHLIETNYKDKLKSCYEKLECWYWISVFSDAYSSSANTRMARDYSCMEKWFGTDEIPEEFKTFQKDFDHLLKLGRIENIRGAVFCGVLSLLALAGARDWDTNAPVLNQTTFENHEVDVDHIFPKSKYSEKHFNESILNKTWLCKETNEKLKRAKKPSEFIDETEKKNFAKSDEDFKKTMASHFINEKALEALKNDDHEMFVREREKTILHEIARRIGSKKKEFQSSVS